MLLLGRSRPHLGGLLLCFRSGRLPRPRTLLLPLRDLRLGRDKPAAREGESRFPSNAVLHQPLLVFVCLERVLGIDDKAEYGGWDMRLQLSAGQQ